MKTIANLNETQIKTLKEFQSKIESSSSSGDWIYNKDAGEIRTSSGYLVAELNPAIKNPDVYMEFIAKFPSEISSLINQLNNGLLILPKETQEFLELTLKNFIAYKVQSLDFVSGEVVTVLKENDENLISDLFKEFLFLCSLFV